MAPLLPALRDRVHVHGQRDDAYGGHRGSHPAPGNSRAAGASRHHEQRHRQGRRRHRPNATADSAEDGTATSTGASQTNPADANTTDTATPGTADATGTPAPSLRAQTNGTPDVISATSQTTYAHYATASQNGVTFTVSWNDAPAGTATTFHVTQTNGSSQAKARMDVPTYWDGGSQESVCDPSRPAWASYYSLRARARDRAQRIHVGPQFTCMELAKVPIPTQKW